MASNFPRMMQNWCERVFCEFDTKRKQRFSEIRSKEQMQEFVRTCRTDIRRLYCLPEEKTPLNQNVTGEILCDGYRIEKILFESRPEFTVTANLYIPKGDGPFPCVLVPCGHSDIGKAFEKYQRFSAVLARKGFLTLMYDPIGQGERVQNPGRSGDYGCVVEHITDGRKQLLLGDFFGTWRAWDGIRALDYLLERPEADTFRVGLSGQSGGGTMTTILTALDDRFTMAAPTCYVTTFRRNLFNELPADTEQILPGIIAAGYEEYDHFTAAAPRPTLIGAKEDDFFDVRGTAEAYEYLQHVYDILGCADDIEMTVGRGGHGLDADLRKAIYGFFCRHAGMEDDGREPSVEVHEPEELFATKNGYTVNEHSKRVVDFTREQLKQAEKHRPGFSPGKLRDLLALCDLPEKTPDYRILRPRDGGSRIAAETEDSVFTILKYSVSGAAFRLPRFEKAVVYLPDVDDEHDIRNESLIKECNEKDVPVFILSVRGTGESAYGTCGNADYFSLYDADFFYASHCLMFGMLFAGRRVFDLLRVVQLLKSEGYKKIELCGRGLGAVIALYAAPFIPELEKLKLVNCISSCAELIQADAVRWPESVLVRDLLNYFDLPDIIEYLEKTIQVSVAQPWDAEMKEAAGNQREKKK